MKISFPAVELGARIDALKPYKLLINDKDVVQQGSHTAPAIGNIKSCSLGLQRPIILIPVKIMYHYCDIPDSFSFKFLSIFVNISCSFDPVTLAWASLERSYLAVELRSKDCGHMSPMILINLHVQRFCATWQPCNGNTKPCRIGLQQLIDSCQNTCKVSADQCRVTIL